MSFPIALPSKPSFTPPVDSTGSPRKGCSEVVQDFFAKLAPGGKPPSRPTEFYCWKQHAPAVVSSSLEWRWTLLQLAICCKTKGCSPPSTKRIREVSQRMREDLDALNDCLAKCNQ